MIDIENVLSKLNYIHDSMPDECSDDWKTSISDAIALIRLFDDFLKEVKP